MGLRSNYVEGILLWGVMVLEKRKNVTNSLQLSVSSVYPGAMMLLWWLSDVKGSSVVSVFCPVKWRVWKAWRAYLV